MTDAKQPWEDLEEAEEASWAYYFSETPEEQSVRHITEQLNDFVDAWEAVEDARKRASEYRSSNPPPQPSKVFETVAELADYNRRWEQHAAVLREIDGLVKTTEERLADVSKRVEAVLPPDTSVLYSYGEQREGYAGRCRIVHSSSTTLKIQLMPLSS